jgi:proline iminopeptidase
MRHAEDMATPWFGVNQDCYDAIWTELRQTWHESALVPASQALDIPVLIIDGADDLRPRWAVDSLEHALPHATRRILPADRPGSRFVAERRVSLSARNTRGLRCGACG